MNVLRREAKEERFGDVVQGRLLEGEELHVGPELAFTFPGDYPARRPYRGAVRFRKHYYDTIEHMNDEEVKCAEALEALPGVKYWVRNLEKRPKWAFWLPTTEGRFYPDFVAELDDGRYLVVEYKGEHLATGADTQEKKEIGELWSEASEGVGLFYLATKDNYEQIGAWVGAGCRG